MKSLKLLTVFNRIIISIFLLALVCVHSQSNKIVNQDSTNTFQEAIKLINLPEPTFKPYIPVAIMKGATHNGIRHNMEAMRAVKKWITVLN